MTLSSRHRIRNSSPGGLRPSTLPLGHGGSPQYWLSHVDGEETLFVSFKPPRPGTEPRTLAWKAAVLTTTLGPPPRMDVEPACLLPKSRLPGLYMITTHIGKYKTTPCFAECILLKVPREMKWLGPYATFMHIQAKLDQYGEMNQMPLVSRHRIRTLAFWGRGRYLSVTEALHNIEF